MKRRGNNEGSIYRRQNGSWGGYIRLPDGNKQYFYGRTRKEVGEKIKKALFEQRQGTYVEANPQTLGQYLRHWLENDVKYNIRQRSYERYEQYVRVHIIPVLGRVKLQALTPQHIQSLRSKKLKEGLSPTTVGTIQIVLHKALSDAVKIGLLPRNVCDAVSLPRKEQHELQLLTADQARKFLSVAAGHPNEALFVLALATGMRRGELLGLKWQDIDLVNGVLQVRRVLVRIPTVMGKGAGTYVESEPKTKQSRRRIVLADFAVEALKRHRALQEQWQLAAGKAWESRGYVFTTQLGRYIHPNSLRAQFQMLLKKAGLPEIRFHDLRHSAASLLLAHGIHPKVVQEILGHSQISITMDIYSHVMPTMHQDAMKKMNETFLEGDSEEEEDDDDDDDAGGVLVPV